MDEQNCILYDWLTFSTTVYTQVSIFDFLLDWKGQNVGGLKNPLLNLDWVVKKGSRLNYEWMMSYHGMTIHYTTSPRVDLITGQVLHSFNSGVCVEFSGSGCRAFETYGLGQDIGSLLSRLIQLPKDDFNISRLDIAYDDFTGVIPLDIMARQAEDFSFTSRLQRRRIINESIQSQDSDCGLTVTHGSRSSRCFFRCYDKRFERSAQDDFGHWVRFEIQLRDENALAFALTDMPIGAKFSAVVNEYLCYREPNLQDTNKRRWPVSPWWSAFVASSARIKLSSRKDEDYNKDRLHDYVYEHLANLLITTLLLDGQEFFFKSIAKKWNGLSQLPDKYQRLLKDNHADTPEVVQAFMDVLHIVPDAAPSAPKDSRTFVCSVCGFVGSSDDFVTYGINTACTCRRCSTQNR